MVRADVSARSNCETIGAVKRGGIKVSEITITEKTEETKKEKNSNHALKERKNSKKITNLRF